MIRSDPLKTTVGRRKKNSTMSRTAIVAGAQLGAIHLTTPRSEVLTRMLKLMDEAHHSKHAKLIVYPEIAFTTFFPRYLLDSQDELEKYFEREVDGDPTKAPGMRPVFDRARGYGMDVSVGYAEHDTGRPESEHVHYNTAVYYSAALDAVVAKYRKVHLPGTVEPFPEEDAVQQLEKRYFRPGNLGFEAFRIPGLIEGVTQKKSSASMADDTVGKGDPILGMLICNDRRWPEAWRCYGLQGVELILCGYNTTAWAPQLLGTNKKIKDKEMAKSEALFHNRLCIQAGSYHNACWSINVAKCGVEDGKFPLIGGSCIVDPDGEIVAEAGTEEDELVVAEIDLEECTRGKGKVFDFQRHRRVEHYGRIVQQPGVAEPPLL